MRGFLRRAAVVLLALLVAGCSFLKPGADRAAPGGKAEYRDYKKSRATRPLEVPPDLVEPAADEFAAILGPDGGTATFSEYQESGGGNARRREILPTVSGVRVERDGGIYWLVVEDEPAAVWDKVVRFWTDNGYPVKVKDPAIGIVETDWLERRDEIPLGVFRKLFNKVFEAMYTSEILDKFRVRIERGSEPGTTEIYLTHQRLEEVSQGETAVWESRPPVPELEIEMLKRLMVYLGAESEEAQKQFAKHAPSRPKALLARDDEGGAVLILNYGFPNAWRRLGIALDHVGFTIQDRDRARGVYYVRYNDPLAGKKPTQRSWLSKLAFWRREETSPVGDEYRLSLTGKGDRTRVMVLNKEGERETSETATRILTLLYEQLK